MSNRIEIRIQELELFASEFELGWAIHHQEWIKEKGMEMVNNVAVALAEKAKVLLQGMQERVKRNPDVADFATAFRPLLQQFEKAEIDNTQEERCLEKAKMRGDIAFTLVGQDFTSPATICHWIELNIETAPVEKLRNALERALAMRAKQRRKRAD